MRTVLSSMDDIMRSECNENQDTTFSFWPGTPCLIKKLLSDDDSTFSFDTKAFGLGLTYFDTKLNTTQTEAVLRGIGARHLSIIHGPPGTGKSATLVELIRQLVNFNIKILVCGPSNGAVDNILERLCDKGVNCLRFGNPARIQIQKVIKHSVAVQIEESKYGPMLKSLRERIDSLKFKKNTRAINRKYDLSYLTKALKAKEAEAIDYLFNNAQVVFSTLNGVGSRSFEGKKFDVLVIDEATQALEPDCWVAIAHCDKVILAGDHHQLPPTVLSKKTELEATMFQRLFRIHRKYVSTLLTTQYRMHQDIMGFSSDELYEGKLIAHASVKFHLLEHLPKIKKQAQIPPLVFLDTSRRGYLETSFGQSKQNEGECKLVEKHLDYLIKAGLPTKDIAVISPYNAQVGLIKKTLGSKYQNLYVGSVDGFQGRESEAVIISLVRSNNAAEIGFLKDYRRLNVAITRARRHLYVIGDSETTMTRLLTISKEQPHNNFLYRLGKYIVDKGVVEYPVSLCDTKIITSTTDINKKVSSALPKSIKAEFESTKNAFSEHKQKTAYVREEISLMEVPSDVESPSSVYPYVKKSCENESSIIVSSFEKNPVPKRKDAIIISEPTCVPSKPQQESPAVDKGNSYNSLHFFSYRVQKASDNSAANFSPTPVPSTPYHKKMLNFILHIRNRLCVAWRFFKTFFTSIS